MSKASEALADVRGWLCDNLSDEDAGKVCGMLSDVSRHVNELEEENARLRKLVVDYDDILAIIMSNYNCHEDTLNDAVQTVLRIRANGLGIYGLTR